MRQVVLLALVKAVGGDSPALEAFARNFEFPPVAKKPKGVEQRRLEEDSEPAELDEFSTSFQFDESASYNRLEGRGYDGAAYETVSSGAYNRIGGRGYTGAQYEVPRSSAGEESRYDTAPQPDREEEPLYESISEQYSRLGSFPIYETVAEQTSSGIYDTIPEPQDYETPVTLRGYNNPVYESGPAYEDERDGDKKPPRYGGSWLRSTLPRTPYAIDFDDDGDD